MLYWGIRHASEVFGVKTFYITENGAAFDDAVTPEGEIIDLDRREYIRNHLIEHPPGDSPRGTTSGATSSGP